MDKFDRDMQRKILDVLYKAFPEGPESVGFYELVALYPDESRDFVANLLYLEEHKLITSGLQEGIGGFMINESAMRITAKGIDFLQQDGGLSAILNVTTIKFHRDAVVVLEDLIALSNMSDTEKEDAKSTLGELSLEALKVVVQTATTAGLAALTK